MAYMVTQGMFANEVSYIPTVQPNIGQTDTNSLCN